jgi:hypothetical protein
VQKPGKSEQVVGTPTEFIDAVEHRFGPILLDVAALSSNRVRQVRWFGPGSSYGEDAFAAPSWKAVLGGISWLNPGFDDIARWVARAKAEGEAGARIALLVPLSSSNWAAEFVHGHAQVEALNPRLRFVGHTQVFPKDLMLALYGPGFAVGFHVWQWKPSRVRGVPKIRTRGSQPASRVLGAGGQPLLNACDDNARTSFTGCRTPQDATQTEHQGEIPLG